MFNQQNHSEGADTLISTHFRQGQLPWQVQQASAMPCSLSAAGS